MKTKPCFISEEHHPLTGDSPEREKFFLLSFGIPLPFRSGLHITIDRLAQGEPKAQSNAEPVLPLGELHGSFQRYSTTVTPSQRFRFKP